MEAAARSQPLGEAVESYQAKDFARAGRSCRRFLRGSELDALGPLAQFLWAASEFRRGELNRSYDLFEDLERKFPASELGPQIARWELAIASRFLAGHKEKLLGLRIRDMRADAQVVLERLVERYPYGQLTDRLLARLGDCYRATGDYAQAVLYYDRLLRDFPRSPVAGEVEFSRLECMVLDCSGPGHDISGLREAEQGLRAFIGVYPREPRGEQAQQYLRTVRELEAEHAFRIAEFYVTRERWEAARRYFRLVQERFGETAWGPRASRRLTELTPPPLLVGREEPEP
jgi:outer membrane assembly lipoprotein YfiO